MYGTVVCYMRLRYIDWARVCGLQKNTNRHCIWIAFTLNAMAAIHTVLTNFTKSIALIKHLFYNDLLLLALFNKDLLTK